MTYPKNNGFSLINLVRNNGLGMITLCLSLLISSCGEQTSTSEKLHQDLHKTQNLADAPGLTFENVTLEQSNDQGVPLWKIKAKKAVYSSDQKNASIENIVGNLFQDGKLVLKVKANKGRVEKDGEKLYLEGDIVATDQRNETTITANYAQWIPSENRLAVKDKITGRNQDVILSAEEGNYNAKTQQMTLFKKVVAIQKNPEVELQTESLNWLIPQKKLLVNSFLQVFHGTVTQFKDKLLADAGEYDLKNKIATVSKNVELSSIDPQIKLATHQLKWSLRNRTITALSPLTVIDTQKGTNLQGNQGQLDLTKKMAYLSGGIAGHHPQNQASISANQVTWNLTSKQIFAEGNVLYQQSNPTFNTRGSMARGNLATKDIIVTQKQGAGKVVTEIIP